MVNIFKITTKNPPNNSKTLNSTFNLTKFIQYTENVGLFFINSQVVLIWPQLLLIVMSDTH